MWIDIPAAPGFSQTVGLPGTRIELPIVAFPVRWRLALIAALYGFGAWMSSFLVWVLANGLAPTSTTYADKAGIAFLYVFFLPASAVLALFQAGSALTFLVDACRRGPALIIATDAVHDRRTGLFLPFKSIHKMHVGWHSSYLILETNHCIKSYSTNIFRTFKIYSNVFSDYRSLVSISHLSVDSRSLVHAVASLTEANGGFTGVSPRATIVDDEGH
ncbi:hypothetical protein [Methylopila turkensis]|uniref:Uncharacterized protein n=1 Tax=Methylopila turkensis TaxID=1437816 RepID=A0A9W6N4W6_9HYPH|nr:hypothetical protein [Methylopila turkensis]GLK78564.1 hypothetical protein GCM10008174_03050 [Methylopila turkensis]